uniref:UTP--glucose-1-phosphate uridylyltransferase n=1 Tax=Propithecus coquereli TaxID=379532 RepID=A0A2K6FFA8_PROCO
MSQDGASQFQEDIQQELELSVETELENGHTKKDLDGFQKLFHRFLQEKETSVDWGKIQGSPENLIQSYKKIKTAGADCH